jgi:hypothetical protein
LPIAFPYVFYETNKTQAAASGVCAGRRYRQSGKQSAAMERAVA